MVLFVPSRLGVEATRLPDWGGDPVPDPVRTSLITSARGCRPEQMAGVFSFNPVLVCRVDNARPGRDLVAVRFVLLQGEDIRLEEIVLAPPGGPVTLSPREHYQLHDRRGPYRGRSVTGTWCIQVSVAVTTTAVLQGRRRLSDVLSGLDYGDVLRTLSWTILPPLAERVDAHGDLLEPRDRWAQSDVPAVTMDDI